MNNRRNDHQNSAKTRYEYEENTASAIPSKNDLSKLEGSRIDFNKDGNASMDNGGGGDGGNFTNTFRGGGSFCSGGGGSMTVGSEGRQSFIKCQLRALFQPTDNKFAMKLFGSKKALMKERIRQKETGHWVIHPCSNFR